MIGDSLERNHYQRITNEVRDQLDEATFVGAWAQGHAMTLDEALSLGLGETEATLNLGRCSF